MKKSLIALAALAVVSAASAQSSVTVSGLVAMDAFTNTKVTTQTGSAAGVDVKGSATGNLNTWATSQISFAGTEDLGGGLKAMFTINSGITGASFVGDRDTNVALQGGFGTVKLGRFAPAAATGFHGLSGSASTAIGSMYGLVSTSATSGPRFGNLTGGSFERNNNNAQYTSPTVSGFTLNANYGSNKSTSTALAGDTNAIQSGLGIAYANGPLSISAGLNTRDADTQAVDAVASSATKLQVLAVADKKVTANLNWIGASYDLGAAKLFATNVSRKDKTTANTGVTTTNADVNVTSLGVSVPVNAYTFNASFYTGKDKVSALSTDDTKLSGYQLSALYAMSKRTSLYAVIGKNDVKRDGGNTAGAARKETVSAFGLVHSF